MNQADGPILSQFLISKDPSSAENSLDTAEDEDIALIEEEKERSIKEMISAVNFNNLRQIENGSFIETGELYICFFLNASMSGVDTKAVTG